MRSNAVRVALPRRMEKRGGEDNSVQPYKLGVSEGVKSLSSLPHDSDDTAEVEKRFRALYRLLVTVRSTENVPCSVDEFASLLRLLRRFLLDPYPKLREVVLRIVRALLLEERLDTLIRSNILLFVCRSLERESEIKRRRKDKKQVTETDRFVLAERAEALKLLRRFLQLLEQTTVAVPKCVVMTLVAVAGARGDDFRHHTLEDVRRLFWRQFSDDAALH
ncbi:MAG: hypothetical protein MHM6MM_004037, partial [Cercozoa sp. M6MM]